MKSLLDLIKFLYGPKAISSTIGTRTNVIRLPSGKLQKYLSKDLNIEAASDAAAQNAYKEMQELIPEVAKMNDGERLVFEGNLRRLKNKLEDSGLIQKENVSSVITALESKVEQLRQKGKELEKVTGEKATLTDVLNDLGASQQSMSRLNDEGLVRAAARQILINDIKAGKIKNITVSEAINMGEPLDPFRQIYGEGALEQLDSLIPNLRGLKTEMEAEKLARSKFKFEPDENRLPGSVSIEEGRKAEQEFGINKPAKVSDFKAEATKRTSIDDLIDEYNANQDRLRLSDEEGGTAIGYEEFQKIQKRNEDIAKALEDKGISSKVEEAPQAEIIPFRKKPTEPEKKAKGGSVGLDYLMGIEPEDTTRENYGLGSGLKVVTKEPAAGLMIQLDRPLQPGDPVGSYYIPPGDGSGLSSIIRAVPQPSAPSITLDAKPAVVRPEDDVVNRYKEYLNSTTPVQSDLEKRYKEFINPILTTKPGDTRSLEELRSFSSSEVDSLGRRYDDPRYYATGGRVGFKIGSGKKILKALGFNTRSEFEKLNLKHDKDIVKAADEIGANLDDPKMGAQQIAEVYADMKFGKDYYDLPQNQQLDLYSKAYNYLTDMGILRRQSNAVTKYNAGEELGQFDQKMIDQINDKQQKEILTNFDTTERKPNSKGGLNYLLGL